jgi:hypothetical protein
MNKPPHAEVLASLREAGTANVYFEEGSARRNVSAAAARQVVHDEGEMALLQQPINDVATDKPHAPGDQSPYR